MGPRLPMWLQTQTEYTYLTMSNASIIDLVPEWFFRISSNAIDIDLSHNFFSGPIPQNIHLMLPKLESFDLSHNSFSGSIPRSLCKLKDLYILDLSSNHLAGELPQCKGGELQMLWWLDLSFNNLSGVIPNSIGNMVNLRSLYLRNNKFNGQIPPSLKNFTTLRILDLGENKLFGSIPTWIGKNMTSFMILRLRQNQISGVIPLQLCLLSNLQLLDLVHNVFFGTIPHCFGNFSRMIFGVYHDEFSTYGDKTMIVIKGLKLEYTTTLQFVTSLDLSSNKLDGKMPKELTDLLASKSLNLSKNRLEGSIPDTIGKMVSLESLDLSENQFFGRIPQSMSELTYLGYLNVSHNKLSGRIPFGNQLQTFTDPSIYADNLGICGAPLENKCLGDVSLHLPPTIVNRVQENEKDESGITSFYIGLASGHIVGFWGICGVLFFNRTWRKAFFQFVSGVQDWLLVTIVV